MKEKKGRSVELVVVCIKNKKGEMCVGFHDVALVS